MSANVKKCALPPWVPAFAGMTLLVYLSPVRHRPRNTGARFSVAAAIASLKSAVA
jgi:hypothetical protein